MCLYVYRVFFHMGNFYKTFIVPKDPSEISLLPKTNLKTSYLSYKTRKITLSYQEL